jgi:hypothetical protein
MNGIKITIDMKAFKVEKLSMSMWFVKCNELSSRSNIGNMTVIVIIISKRSKIKIMLNFSPKLS